ncbi:hypothetical protein [Clostridium sp. 1001271B_151109_B4]|uniref:hypothetical protein n=1 Tax=Clostridium sp. 1001271B_151109_B4 TaxID=2787148 RepID=UPI0018A95712|nr:hypothetical protein [Clostridium sp. 1001271B_151109_B4]
MYGNNESKRFFQGESTEPRSGSGQGTSERSYGSFTELINELYPICLDCGITPNLFHESTIDELIDLIKSYERREEARQKENIVLNYMLARQIGENVAILFDKDAKVTQLWDLYPDLFQKEKEINDKRAREAEMEAYKAKFTAFAYSVNSKKGGTNT